MNDGILQPNRFFVQEAARLFCIAHPVLAEIANGRIERAIDIAASGNIAIYGRDSYLVRGLSHPRNFYLVDFEQRACACPDFARQVKRGGRDTAICQHAIGVRFALDALELENELAADLVECDLCGYPRAWHDDGECPRGNLRRERICQNCGRVYNGNRCPWCFTPAYCEACGAEVGLTYGLCGACTEQAATSG